MNPITRFWNKLDPKLKYTLLTAAVTYALTRYAITLDPALSAIVSGAISSIVGYNVENGASELTAIPPAFVLEDAGGLDSSLVHVAENSGLAPVREAELVPQLNQTDLTP
jgi:hypothetical protein